jgi:hypothetical protein
VNRSNHRNTNPDHVPLSAETFRHILDEHERICAAADVIDCTCPHGTAAAVLCIGCDTVLLTGTAPGEPCGCEIVGVVRRVR